MNVKLEVTIKLEKGKEIKLDSKDAEALYLKLKEIYEKSIVYTHPYVYPWTYYPDYYKWVTTTTCDNSTTTYTTNTIKIREIK